jgi:CDR ABC transporter
MFSPISQLPSGATWVSYIDPIFHTFSAVTPGQYYTNPSPNITVTSGSVFVTETLYQYTSNYYSISYDQRWIQYGYLVCFIAVFAPLYLLSVKYVRWIVR